MLLLLLIPFAVFLYAFYWLLRYVIIDPLLARDIRGKTILVVGSTTGFGHDFALKCVKNGAIVFAGCNSPSGIDLLAQECEGLQGRIFPFKLDISSQDSIDKAYEFVMSQLENCLGQQQGLWAIVNNAGIIIPGADDWLTPEDYDTVWRLNTLGIIRITHKFKKMLKIARGRIVNCSSICGRLAFSYYGPYTVSKFAMEAYSDTIRRELAPFGVKVCIVEPSYFKTPLTNPAYIPKLMKASFYKSPKEVQDEYGDEFIEGLAKKHEEFLASDWNSPHAEWVVDCYYHAVVSPFPKKRYVVGNEANYIFIPISRLTADLQDMSLRFFDHKNNLPVPKAVQHQQTNIGKIKSN